MGSNYCETIIDDMPPAKVREAFVTIHEDAQHESGHGGYTGTFAEVYGVTVETDKSFDSIEAARAYVEDTQQKWESALAVRVPAGWYIGAWCSS